MLLLQIFEKSYNLGNQSFKTHFSNDGQNSLLIETIISTRYGGLRLIPDAKSCDIVFTQLV